MGHWPQMFLLVAVLPTYRYISGCLLGTVLGIILQENTGKIDLQSNGNMVGDSKTDKNEVRLCVPPSLTL